MYIQCCDYYGFPCVNGVNINAFDSARSLGAAVMGPLQALQMDVVITPCGMNAFVAAEKHTALRSTTLLNI